MPVTLARRARRSVVESDRGSISVEYVVLVGAVGLLVAGALVALGPAYVRHYEVVRNLILIPAP